MFERIISIDWSGAGREDDRVNLRVAAWDRSTGLSRIQLPSEASSTRSWRRNQCRAFLQEILSGSARTLVAADFGFGLPWGADLAIFDVQGWREMIRCIGREYAGAGTARAAAQAINAWPQFGGHGPYRFDCCRTDFGFYLNHGVGYYRLTEMAAPQAISQWYLGSGGTVGFHSITGMSALDALIDLRERSQIDFAVWPFEPIDPARHVLVESYPAIYPVCTEGYPGCKGNDEKDAWKVLQHLVQANTAGRIGCWFEVLDLRFGRVSEVDCRKQIEFEGFIFGLRA